MSNRITKVLTENPLIDEVVYQCQLMIKDIVLKDEDRANEYETLESIKNFDIYYEIVNGRAKYHMFTYDYHTLRKIPSLTRVQCIEYAKDNGKIPDAIKDQVLKLKSEEYVNTYEEMNNYYRMLNGLPDYGTEGIYITRTQLDMIKLEEFDYGKPVHEMTNNEIKILETFGVLDQLKAQHPELKYLNRLGDKKIDFYKARKTIKFGLLYLPQIETNEVYNKFIDRLEINRVYFLKTCYSEAYKYRSKYYDRVIMIMIIVQTVNDVINLAPEYLIRRELFDMRTMEFLFNACGVDFFPQIPIKYQKRLIKNLNRLIKYKSCNKNLIDIVELFGFDNIKLFKYYILRMPLLDENDEYMDDVIEDPKTGQDVDDVNNNYKLQFLRVPMEEDFDDHIRNDLNKYTYEEITDEDIYWNGIYTKEEVKQEIIETVFNAEITKYVSITTMYSIAEMSFQLAYFINMLLYTKVDYKQLNIEIPEIDYSEKFNLIDLIIFLYSLMYLYNGVEDNIIYDPVQAMDVLGFNFETDMNTLAQYVEEQGFTMEELGVDGFIQPDSVLSFNQLIEIYTNNKNIYDHIVDEMYHANNYKIYNVYKTILQSLYVTKLNFDYFKSKSTGRSPKTYKEYLANNCSALYNIIMECSLINKKDERENAISKYINYVVENIYIYIDSDEFKYIFNNIPTVSVDYIKQYLYLILNFFKSYRVDLVRTNDIYIFDDRLGNRINVIDNILFTYVLGKHDFIKTDDYQKLLINILKKDYGNPIDKLYLDIIKWKRLVKNDYIPILDKIATLIVSLLHDDKVDIKDNISKSYTMDKSTYITIPESLNYNISLNLKDIYEIEDSPFFTIGH